jgi:hypothetical protein
MIKCHNCGFFSMDGAEACVRCGADLRPKAFVYEAPGESRVSRLANAWIALTRPFRLLSYRVRGFFDQPPDESLPYRHPFQAAWLSLLPGLGQIYNGQPRVGALHLGLFAALVGGGVWLILSPVSDFLFLGALLLIVFSMNNALMEAQTINGTATFFGSRRWQGFFLFLSLVALGMWFIQFFALAWIATIFLFFGSAVALATLEGRRKRGAMNGWLGGWLVPALGLVLIGGAFWLLFAEAPLWAWRSVIRLHWHGQDGLTPAVQRADRLLIEGVSTAWRPLQRGDLVFYDPGRYTNEQPTGGPLGGADLFLVNMSSNIERIVGLPGDVFERRNGVFYRNGELVPPKEQPLAQTELPPTFRIEAPPDKYIILMSFGPVEWMPVAGTRKAPAPQAGKPLEGASIIAPEEIFGRVLMIYRPWSRRRWLAN